jgi:hypothetical protein
MKVKIEVKIMATGTTQHPKEKRLCISYLDEVDAYTDQKCEFNYKTMVNFTALKNEYISTIEKDWKAIRVKYNASPGKDIHFTRILSMLGTKPHQWEPEYKAMFVDGKGKIDHKKMHEFYTDILNLIQKSNFVFQATGLASLKSNKKIITKIKMNSTMYQLFIEHVDRIAFYMIDLTIDDYNAREAAAKIEGKTQQQINNIELSYYCTKLRYDGGFDLQERSYYRDAFSHIISEGTKHFSSKTTKEVFDNLSFISKEEIGQMKTCTIPCSIEVISHAGAEIVDFATKFIGRYMWKDFYRDYKISKGENKADIEARIDKMCSINIPGQPKIEPMAILEKKLFESPDVNKIKLIIDHPY